MAKPRIDRERYDKLVEGFREAPANASHAARRAGVDRRTAAKAWRIGWPKYPWARPIGEVLKDEERMARARAAEVEAKAAQADQQLREQARAEAVEARAEEVQLLKVARRDVLGSLVLSAEMLPAMRTLAQHATRLIGEGLDGVSLNKALQVLDRFTRLTAKAISAADSVVKLSRLDRGQPGSILGVQAEAPTTELSYEEALAELEAAGDLLVLLRNEQAEAQRQVIEAEAMGEPPLLEGAEE